MSQENFEALKEFFMNHPVAIKSAAPLKTGVEVGVIFSKDMSEYTFRKEKQGVSLYPGRPKDPDFTVLLGDKVVPKITSLQSNDIGAFGVEFFKAMISENDEEAARVKLNIGFIKITTHGYLKILALGGMTLLKWLAVKGIKGPAGIKEAFDKLKKESEKHKL